MDFFQNVDEVWANSRHCRLKYASESTSQEQTAPCALSALLPMKSATIALEYSQRHVKESINRSLQARFHTKEAAYRVINQTCQK